MATDPSTLDFLLDQLGRRGTRFTSRRMFGEYCLYRDGLPVALVCDDVLFVKDTPAGRDALATFADLDFGPPYPGARLHLRVPPDLWDDGEALRRLLHATADALPPRKVKPASPTPVATRKPKAAKPAKKVAAPEAGKVADTRPAREAAVRKATKRVAKVAPAASSRSTRTRPKSPK